MACCRISAHGGWCAWCPAAVWVADGDAIRAAIARQLAHGRYAPSTIYYRPDTSDRILDVLVNAELYTQKRFFEPAATEVAKTS